MVSKLGKTLYLLVLLLIIGAFVVGGYEALAAPGDQTPVIFPDANLEAAIREAVNKPQGAIYASDLESLPGLVAMQVGISDLTGLEYCTNLTNLKLHSNQISNISPLSSLTKLTHLYIGDNQISDISPLAGLTNLKELGLNNNKISNLAGLEYCTNLTNLDLHSNQISNISPLSSLTKLTHLYIGTNHQISDISPLASLTKLVVLWLNYNQISDISPLSSLTNLIQLKLNSNQITDISPLSSLTTINGLYLGNNRITDISPLASLPLLHWLDLKNNQISDISPLVSLTQLTWPDLTGNPLNATSLNTYIPQLKSRGIRVIFPTWSRTPLAILWAIGIVVILAGLVFTILLFRRRRHKRDENRLNQQDQVPDVEKRGGGFWIPFTLAIVGIGLSCLIFIIIGFQWVGAGLNILVLLGLLGLLAIPIIGLVLSWKKPLLGGIMLILTSVIYPIYYLKVLVPESPPDDFSGVVLIFIIFPFIILPLLISGIVFFIKGVVRKVRGVPTSEEEHRSQEIAKKC